MGALWKVRARLKATSGVASGGHTADVLFNAWLNAYNDHDITTSIRTHWLLLDDTDGIIANGTPHGLDIDGVFRDQGFPGYYPFLLAYVDAANVAPPWFGTTAEPFKDLDQALRSVSNGGAIVMRGGTYDTAPITIDKAITIRSETGSSVIH